MIKTATRISTTLLITLIFLNLSVGAQQNEKVQALVDRAIEAMGGDKYLSVKDYSSEGRYYVIRENRQGWAEFLDWTQLPSRSRFELGKKSDKETTIFDLEAGKGWIMYGDFEVKPASEEQLEEFKRASKRSLENLFRFRIKEEGVTLHYMGAEIINGRKPVEMIQLIDAENDILKIYFEESSGLPYRLEYDGVENHGRKVRIFEEYSNWHVIQGVKTPLRIDRLTAGEPSSQLFINKITYNSGLPNGLFIEPTIKSKK